jgi:hypothetical protein
MTAHTDGLNGGLELSLQELEPMEAPGFWTGVIESASLVAATIGLYALT